MMMISVHRSNNIYELQDKIIKWELQDSMIYLPFQENLYRQEVLKQTKIQILAITLLPSFFHTTANQTKYQ
ncbi:General transcription and DNA repair factor IIH helicase subunit XPB [Dirofilaria immitis]